MKKEKIRRLFDFMFGKNTTVFVNMDYGFDVEGFVNTSADQETGKLKSKDGDSIAFQSCSLTDGTGRRVELRINTGCQQEVNEYVNLCDLFPERQIVIITGGDSLYGLAPVVNNKLELVEFIVFLREYYKSLPEIDKWAAGRHLDEMENLAIWLFKNNPKEKETSLLDEIEDKLR